MQLRANTLHRHHRVNMTKALCKIITQTAGTNLMLGDVMNSTTYSSAQEHDFIESTFNVEKHNDQNLVTFQEHVANHSLQDIG